MDGMVSMESGGTRRLARRPTMLVLLAVLGAVLACALPTCGGSGGAMQLTLCAVDAPQASACDSTQLRAGKAVTGDMRRQHETQVVRVLALQGDGQHAAADTALTVTVQGANPRTLSATSDASGLATLSYQGDQLGSDIITVAPQNGAAFQAGRPIVVHWLAQRGYAQPIIFLHGINEDANVIEGHQEWTSLFEALTITFDPTAIEAFCYHDDRAYADPTQPANCLPPGASPCASSCVSQSGVDINAVDLAEDVIALYGRTGKRVTLMGYSMGTAIIRTLLAGCLNTPATLDSDNDGDTDQAACQTAAAEINQVFFLNGVQQGSWLMTVKRGLDAATLAGEGIPAAGSSPFASALPSIEQGIFGSIKDRMGLDANSAAAADLTPLSANILAHNSVPLPPGVSAYAFYGNIQLQLGLNEYVYPAAGQTPLPLGDLVLLAQQDDPRATPPWGGAALCGGCGPLGQLGYHASQSGQQFHAWALTQRIPVNIADIVPGVGPSFQSVLNAPENHLNITQPAAQAPGSSVQVQDITHLAGSQTTDMAYEIALILMQNAGIA